MSSIVVSREQVREFDRRAVEDYGVPGIVLMENAGRGVADYLAKLQIAGPVVICCGSGNNAGDGFVIARHLDLRGVCVRVCLFADPAGLQGDAATNCRIIERAGIPTFQPSLAELPELLAGAAWIVDAIFGTGFRGEPRSPIAEAIEVINRQGIPILAVDVPSGLDCDTGRPARVAIRATQTCTFVAAKRGFLEPSAREYLGTLQVLDIGAPRKLFAEMFGQ